MRDVLMAQHSILITYVYLRTCTPSARGTLEAARCEVEAAPFRAHHDRQARARHPRRLHHSPGLLLLENMNISTFASDTVTRQQTHLSPINKAADKECVWNETAVVTVASEVLCRSTI